MQQITVVGGGLTGLIAAIECAEAGASVRLLEARHQLGGRATTTPGDFHANLGPHAFYSGGSLWRWLKARRLHSPYRIPSSPAIRFRWDDELRRLPPRDALRVLRLARVDAPIDQSFADWVASRTDERVARAASGLAGVVTFDHDPGRLSAQFVWSRVQRILIHQPVRARYVVGGWGAVVDRLAEHAASVGVAIETGAKVDHVRDLDGPVIVATEPRAARHLLEDASLRPSATRTALLDVGLTHRRGDPYLVLDLDEGSFTNRFTAIDRTLAPVGHDLVQAMVGMRPDEPLDAGVARLERVLDAGIPGWGEREVWRRRAAVHESSGAIDLPGTTWRDRTPVAYADGIWLAGDWVAAPGHLAEVGCASAISAAAEAVAAVRAPRLHVA